PQVVTAKASLLLCLLLTDASAFAAEVDAITTKEQFGSFAQDYYLDPRPELVESAMRFAGGSDLVKQPNTARLVQMSFSCIFARHPERREAWKKAIATLDETSRAYFSRSMDHTPQQLLDALPVSPEKNDVNWSCFFVSGDARYARNVVGEMKYLPERKDMQKFLAATSAQWSLASISMGHDRVREVLEAAAKGDDAVVAAGARDALSRPVAELRQSAIQTLRQQRDAGIWK
ncbi:MAG TPA: hypothetical protein VM146_08645, partial [Steroidobacteraceae bacterium]|nr:hypothetical protein [Steroidobacteraceae bacterium]